MLDQVYIHLGLLRVKDLGFDIVLASIADKASWENECRVLLGAVTAFPEIIESSRLF